MKKVFLAAAVMTATLSASAMAQTAPLVDSVERTSDKSGVADTPKVYHAGGRHDQRLHEATLRARANGQKMERLPVHAGGRHDAWAHEAAIKADEKRIAEQTRP